MGKLAFYAGTRQHFAAYLVPIWKALPEDIRGPFIARSMSYRYAKDHGVPAHEGVPRREPLVIVASYEDYRACQKAEVVLVNHGIGQTYLTGRGVGHSSYTGGKGRERVIFNLSPSQRDADACEQPAVAIGPPPYLDPFIEVPRPRSDDKPVVAISFHADNHVVPETRWAWPYYHQVLTDLARHQDALPFRLLGHAHPRVANHLRAFWGRLKVPFEADWTKVLGVADCYAVDNSSSLYEFAATDRPVVTLSAPWYRRDVHHGCRFWEAIPGIHVESPDDLLPGICEALDDSPVHRYERSKAVRIVYGDLVDGRSTDRAVTALVDFMHGRR